MTWIKGLLAFCFVLEAVGHNPLVVTDFAARGHIFQRLLTDDWLWCIQMCFSYSRCVSYNFHKQSSTCELNDCGIDICGDQNEELVFSSGCVYQQLREGARRQARTFNRRQRGPDQYSLTFANDNVEFSYVMIQNLTFNLSAFTVCFWMKTDDETNKGTPFSYSTTSTSNELLVYNYQNFVLYINGEKRDTNVAAADGRWHHICATWENNAGSWQLFKDGVLKKNGQNFKTGYVIPGGGVLVLGEEQDEPGSGFDSSQSFRGQMTGVHLWDFVLHHHDILNLFSTCQTGRGNVLAWSHFIDAQRGDGVTVTAMLPC